jgi:predicted nucleotidyltransferase/HEPN domain-containing protein
MARQAEAARTCPEKNAREPLERLIALIVQELHPEQVWLFGSRARGDAHSDSDYDLFVVVPDDTPREKIGLASTHQLARQAPMPVDVLACPRDVFAHERDLLGTLSYTVAREGVILYGGDHGLRPNSNSMPMASGGRRRTVTDVILRWLERADLDLRIVRNCLEGPVPSPEGAAYHCQQAAEKIVKAGLITAGVHPPKEHNIGNLVQLLPSGNALVLVFRPLEPLSKYITAFRYPDDPEIPVPSLQEIEVWLAQLLNAKNAVVGGIRPER